MAADCLSDLDNTAADCSFELPDTTITSNNRVRAGVAKGNARYLDVVKMFCLKQICPTVVGDIVVYADGDHITATYGNWLTDVLELPN